MWVVEAFLFDHLWSLSLFIGVILFVEFLAFFLKDFVTSVFLFELFLNLFHSIVFLEWDCSHSFIDFYDDFVFTCYCWRYDQNDWKSFLTGTRFVNHLSEKQIWFSVVFQICWWGWWLFHHHIFIVFWYLDAHCSSKSNANFIDISWCSYFSFFAIILEFILKGDMVI